MMTVVTHVTLHEGAEPEWDDAMRQRLDAATGRRGWIGGQLIPLDGLNERSGEIWNVEYGDRLGRPSPDRPEGRRSWTNASAATT
jgi:hypothetical protein